MRPVRITALACVALALGSALTACSSSGGPRAPGVTKATKTAGSAVSPTVSGPSGTDAASGTSATSSTSTPTSSTSTPSTTTSSTLAATTTTLPGNPAGALPQTDVLPSSSSPQFLQEIRDLWQGITSGSFVAAMPAFFPEAAYVQLKAISDPADDWRWRLVADFELDLDAAHQYLGSGAQSAKLIGVEVAGDEVAWIPPGYCYNSIGYWHAPAVRLVYSENGMERSIGIASLISWRGEWYVVHLGAVLRSSTTGIVDDPSTGQGTFAPPGGC